jgi:hypothetical protein
MRNTSLPVIAFVAILLMMLLCPPAQSATTQVIGPTSCPYGYVLRQECSIWGPWWDFKCYVVVNECVRDPDNACVQNCVNDSYEDCWDNPESGICKFAIDSCVSINCSPQNHF